jgi:hypothetical protein
MFQPLHNVLEAYACYRPDIGYVQGMSFLAAVLLLNMDVSDAFLCLANLISRPCHLAFFRVDEEKISAYFELFNVFFNQYLPKLCSHFKSLNITPSMFLLHWYTPNCPVSLLPKIDLSIIGFVPFTADLCHWMWLVACGMSTSVMVMNSSSEQL